MSDLISREALLEVISDKWEEASPLSIINIIANAPAIEQGNVVGYIDEFGNFENSVKQWMIDEPDVKWKPLYTSPPKQAIPEDVIKDAERYNWLKQNYHGFEMFRHSTIPYVTLDREVDKAMLNSTPTLRG